MTNVNYIIAVCLGRLAFPNGETILRTHLQQLEKTDLIELTQVTLMIPPYLQEDLRTKQYLDLSTLGEELRQRIIVLPFDNNGISYAAWIKVCQKYKQEFDYYIFMEDDYYPCLRNFVSVLIQEHQYKLPNGGFLNSYTTNHAAMCFGIIDSKTFLQRIESVPDPLASVYKPGIPAWESQMGFSGLMGKNITDYTDKYRSLYFSSTLSYRQGGPIECVEVTHDINLNLKQDIFRPIEYLTYGENMIKGKRCEPLVM